MVEYNHSPTTALFMMEMGLHSSIPTYSGGMGALGGDMVKAAADLGLPLVAVTLLYNQGYFKQDLDPEGNQIESYGHFDPSKIMIELPQKIKIRAGDHDINIKTWEFDYKGRRGTVPVYFLDTNRNGNKPEDADITSRLYMDDHRIMQEAVLGIGGAKLLDELGCSVGTYHMNESHSAFLILKLLKELGDIEKVRELCVFTTHSPVAGHENFDYGEVRRIVGDLPGNISDLAGNDRFDMTRLALNSSRHVNGVSRKHGECCGIDYITNGVHSYTWTAKPFQELYDREIPRWYDDPSELRRADRIEKAKVLDAHRVAKSGIPDYTEEKTGLRFDPNRPLISWARRMTGSGEGYKRPELLFSDMEELTKILKKHGAQLLYGGKAHPNDGIGKGMIKNINRALKDLREKGINAAYVRNYEMDDCVALTSFSDIWLYTPRIPREACSTSGMCAADNGVPQLGTLDGWWDEGHEEGVTGWSIGGAESDDARDAQELYRQLDVILPNVGTNEMANVMAGAISKNASYFSAERMMKEYAEKVYKIKQPEKQQLSLVPV